MKFLSYERYLQIPQNINAGISGEFETFKGNSLVEKSIDEIVEHLQKITNSFALISIFHDILLTLLLITKSIDYDTYRSEYSLIGTHCRTLNYEQLYEYVISVLMKYVK